MKQATDEELVHQCLQGNQDAWTVLIRRYRQLIFTVIRSYRLTESDGADVFQAVCLELFHSLPRLRQVPALRKWLVTVTSHQCFRIKNNGLPLNSESDTDVLPDTSTAARHATFERQQLLREAMDQLPPRCRRMIELLFLQEEPLAYNELASQLGLAVGSIGFIRKRCLNKLKTALEQLGF